MIFFLRLSVAPNRSFQHVSQANFSASFQCGRGRVTVKHGRERDRLAARVAIIDALRWPSFI